VPLVLVVVVVFGAADEAELAVVFVTTCSPSVTPFVIIV
jgi:hypothetical protein